MNVGLENCFKLRDSKFLFVSHFFFFFVYVHVEMFMIVYGVVIFELLQLFLGLVFGVGLNCNLTPFLTRGLVSCYGVRSRAWLHNDTSANLISDVMLSYGSRRRV